MKRFLILLALALLALPATAGLLSDVVGDLVVKHGSLSYARSFDGEKKGALATLDVGIGRVGLGSEAELRFSVDLNAAYTREKIAGQEADEDLVFGLGIGGKLVPKKNPEFAIKAGVGWAPGFHGFWSVGATLKF